VLVEALPLGRSPIHGVLMNIVKDSLFQN
jgi:hypothetical protein